MDLALAIKVLLMCIVIPAAGFDLRWRQVPNWLTITGLALGISVNVVLFQSAGLWSSLKGLGLALVIYLPLYLLRGMGGGDVKLMAAVGAITGPSQWLRVFFFTLIVGGATAIVLVVAKRRVRTTFANISVILASLGSGKAPYKDNPQLDVRNDDGLRLPHAVMIACGALALLLADVLGVA